MKPGRGCTTPRFPGEFARPEEGSESHTDGGMNVDAIEVVWDEREEFEKDVLGKREPESTFAFPVKPPSSFDEAKKGRNNAGSPGHERHRRHPCERGIVGKATGWQHIDAYFPSLLPTSFDPFHHLFLRWS